MYVLYEKWLFIMSVEETSDGQKLCVSRTKYVI